jgi:hypothetical protein
MSSMEYSRVGWLLMGSSSKSSNELSGVSGEDKGDSRVDSLERQLLWPET